MLIKEADDRTGDVETLEALLRRPDVTPDSRRRIEAELRQLRAGIAGEREAAYLIDFDMAVSNNWAVIHDLRIEVNGRVAQIDHLIIDRLLDIWICESKHFSEGVAVDEHGEWVAFYGKKPVAVPSPLEQNRRHLAVLEDALKSGLVDLPKRLGLVTIRPQLRSLVLVSNSARISRPPKSTWSRIPGIDTVVKAERYREVINRQYDEHYSLALAKLVGKGTMESVARSLVAIHRPAQFDYAAKFGLPPAEHEQVRSTHPAQQAETVDSTHSAAAPACARCGTAVSAAVVEYCRANEPRFGGEVLCYRCQRRRRQPGVKSG